jgi:hypothetical protein
LKVFAGYRSKIDQSGAFMDNPIHAGSPFAIPVLRGIRRFGDARRGTASIVLALVLGGMVTVTGLGFETAEWDAANASARRTADIAANAGTIVYAATGNAKTAAIAAAQVAQLNGIAGGIALRWDGASNTLSGGALWVQVIHGVEDVNDVAVKVSVGEAEAVVLRGPASTPPETVAANDIVFNHRL